MTRNTSQFDPVYCGSRPGWPPEPASRPRAYETSLTRMPCTGRAGSGLSPSLPPGWAGRRCRGGRRRRGPGRPGSRLPRPLGRRTPPRDSQHPNRPRCRSRLHRNSALGWWSRGGGLVAREADTEALLAKRGQARAGVGIEVVLGEALGLAGLCAALNIEEHRTDHVIDSQR